MISTKFIAQSIIDRFNIFGVGEEAVVEGESLGPGGLTKQFF